MLLEKYTQGTFIKIKKNNNYCQTILNSQLPEKCKLKGRNSLLTI